MVCRKTYPQKPTLYRLKSFVKITILPLVFLQQKLLQKTNEEYSMSVNISKDKREKLIVKIKAIRDYIVSAPQDANTGNLLTYLSEIEKDIKGKKYGLVFEEHRECIDEVLSTHTPVLSEETDLFINNGGQMNFLIEGDNLASLQLLKKTHKWKIDVIYIDPPYNTGHKDFVYDDVFVDKQDGYSHSKWISFMQKRLVLAKSLLKPTGTIFISIDDNEYANLKLLCDAVFNECNLISTIIWNSRKSVSNDAVVSLNHNYILIYTKNIDDFYKVKLKFKLSDAGKGFSNPDNDPRGAWKADPFDSPGIRPNLTYKIVNPNTGVEYLPPKGRCWRTGLQEYNQFVTENRIVFGKNGKSKPQLKRFLSEAQDKGLTPKSIWDDCGTATDGTRELQEIFGSKVFDTPKPTGLIKKVLDLAGDKNSLILDFFAGSGTTGHAVMKLNAEDGGNRKFIICTNNENDICRDITYERIKRVIDKEGYNASLKYYKVDYIPISDKLYYEYADELLVHIRELVELENGINFTGNAEIGIVVTDSELSEFITNSEALSKCRKLYMGHDLLPDEEQENILRAHNVEISIIPDYYYRDLQED